MFFLFKNHDVEKLILFCTIQGCRAISVLHLVLDVCCPQREKQLNGVKRCIKSPGPVSLMSYGCWLAQVLYQLAGTLHLSEQKCQHQHLNRSSVLAASFR